MKIQLSNQKTLQKQNSIRFSASFSINLPVEKIDMYQWVTGMTEEDYLAYSTAHQAMGSSFKNGTFHTVNVENVGNETLIQHYELKYHSPSHVQFYSSRTKAYILRWIPAIVGVPWEMQVRPMSPSTSELVCLIGVDFPNIFLKMGAWFNGLNGLFLKRHLNHEGLAFARDIEKKFRHS